MCLLLILFCEMVRKNLLKWLLIRNLSASLILSTMGFLGAAHEGWGMWWGGGGKKPPLPFKICHTYPAMMKFGHSYTLPKEDPKTI